MEFTKEEIFGFVNFKNHSTSDIYPLQQKWGHHVGMISTNGEYSIYLRVFYNSTDNDATYKDYLLGDFISWKRETIIDNILK